MAQFCPFYRSLICNTYSMPCKCDASRLFHTYMLLMHATRCFSALAHVHALQAYCATVLILATSMHASYAFQLWCFSALAQIHARSACYSTVMLLGTWKHVGNGAVKIAQTTKTTWQRKQDKVWPRKTKKGEAAVGESNFEFSYMWSLQHLEHKTWTFHPLFPTRFWVIYLCWFQIRRGGHVTDLLGTEQQQDTCEQGREAPRAWVGLERRGVVLSYHGLWHQYDTEDPFRAPWPCGCRALGPASNRGFQWSHRSAIVPLPQSWFDQLWDQGRNGWQPVGFGGSNEPCLFRFTWKTHPIGEFGRSIQPLVCMFPPAFQQFCVIQRFFVQKKRFLFLRNVRCWPS